MTTMALGWQYIPPAECLKKRGNNREVILRDELVAFLQTRRFSYKGKHYPLSPNAVDQIVREVCSPPMQKQWGSCSPAGLLLLNPHLIKAPARCVDYVLLHALWGYGAGF